jgi:RimJ/RimL family protein N-acetyltransferase
VNGPAYRIVTARLVLRCWSPADAPLLQAVVDGNLAHLSELPWSRAERQSLEEKITLLRKFRASFDTDADYPYGVFDRTESRVLGAAGLHLRIGDGAREIGYWIDAAHTRQGLATEAAAALTRVGFEIEGVRRVEIHCGPANAASIGVARKLGFAHEATLRGRFTDVRGNPRDTMLFSLFADGYAASPATKTSLEAFDAAGRRLL